MMNQSVWRSPGGFGGFRFGRVCSPVFAGASQALRFLRGLSLACIAWACVCGPLCAQPRQPSTFTTTIGMASLCLHAQHPDYYHRYLLKHFGAADRREQGGLFWRTPGVRFYGVPVHEVFVADPAIAPVDSAGGWSFVGMTLESGSPTALAGVIESRTGIRFWSERPDWVYSAWASVENSKITWLGRRDRLRLHCARWYAAPLASQERFGAPIRLVDARP